MAGSMRERRPGYWELRVSRGRDPVTGAARYATRNVRGTKREAQKVLNALVRDVDEGRAVNAAPVTVGELIDRWMAHIETEGRSPTTLDAYRSLIKQLPASFTKRRLRTVTPLVLDALYADLGQKKGRGPATVRKFHVLLRAAFNQAVRWELLDRNPTAAATPPRPSSGQVQPPTIDGVRRVLELARESRNPENAVIFRLMAATGCRRAEACGLRWADVDPKRREVTIRNSIIKVDRQLRLKDTKAHQQRTVKLDAATAAVLAEHRATIDQRAADFEVEITGACFVFSDDPAGLAPIEPERLTQAWSRLATAAGVPARLHDLRHFQASLLLDAGEAVSTVAARLGHRDTATTLRVYAHMMPGADGRAAGIVGDALDG